MMSNNNSFNIYSWFIFKGNIIKEDKVLFVIAKIIYLVAISSVLMGFVAATIISALDSASGHIDFFEMLPIILVGIVIIFSAIFAFWLLKHVLPIEKSRLMIFTMYCLKILFFLFPSTFLFFRREDIPLVETLPLFAISAVALLLSYPTKKKWEKWTKECP